MAWLPFYALEKDIEFLNDWLNQEEEIAFLISQGKGYWKAVKAHEIPFDIGNQKTTFEGTVFVTPNRAEYALWHIPSGALPLITPKSKGKPRFTKDDWNDSIISDPWKGWQEEITGANSVIPYFGAGHPGVFHLEIKTSHADNEIPMSNFGWIGNHYKIIGSAADKTTEKFWNKLRRMVKKVSSHIPRANNPQSKPEIYAFPQAYEAIKSGRPCSINP
jgi:hypothetical protein